MRAVILVRLDGPDGEMIGALVLWHETALRESFLRAREREPSLRAFECAEATLHLCNSETFDSEGACRMTLADDVRVHVSETTFYVTGKLDGEPVSTWELKWSVLQHSAGG
jgi:hypothetical protein